MVYAKCIIFKGFFLTINTARKVLKENKIFNSIKIDTSAELINEDGKESKFKPAAETLIVYEGSGVFYYAQSKYDSAIYIESEDLEI
jgi:hypothetical protein